MSVQDERQQVSEPYRGFHIVATLVASDKGGFRSNCVVRPLEGNGASVRADTDEAFETMDAALSAGVARAKAEVDRLLGSGQA